MTASESSALLGSDWVDPRFPPEIRLFFSVDIEGSTSFKHSIVGGRSTWGPFFLEFFQSFPPTLAKCETDLAALLQMGTSSTFEPWKALGDELVFSKRLSTGFEVYEGLCSAREAIIQGSASLRRHRESRASSGDIDQYPVHLKGTAWLAGFPIKNMKVPTVRAGTVDDYIGPSIDLGFRLTKMSSPWRMAVSTPLAWMAAKVQHEQSASLKGQMLKWSYLGRQTLKGIEGNRAGYPVFCIDVADSAIGMNSEELNLLDRGDIKPRDVIAFCETQFRSEGNQAGKHGRPFILGDAKCGFDLPGAAAPERIQYLEAYGAFLTTQPVVQATMKAGTGSDDANAVISAIDSAASLIAKGTSE